MGRPRQQYDAVAGTNEEGLLHTLIDPSSLGGEDADWEDPHMTENPVVKGIRQPTQCRDSWAAMLFYIQLLGCVIVACMYGVPAITRSSSSGENHGGRSSSAASNADDYEDYEGLLAGETSIFYVSSAGSDLPSMFFINCPLIPPLSVLILWKIYISYSPYYKLITPRSFASCSDWRIYTLLTLPPYHVGMSNLFNTTIITILITMVSHCRCMLLYTAPLSRQCHWWVCGHRFLCTVCVLHSRYMETYTICVGKFIHRNNSHQDQCWMYTCCIFNGAIIDWLFITMDDCSCWCV